MPGHPGGGPLSGPRIEASVGDVHLTPGQTGIVPVLIRNIEYVARNYSLAVVGVDPEWVVVAAWFGPLAPGASATIEIRISLPNGFPACDYSAALHIQPGDPATGAAAGPTITVNLPLTIGDGSLISASLDPPEVRGRERGRFKVLLRNRSPSAMRIELTGTSAAEELKVRFAEPVIALMPGQEASVKAAIHGHRPIVGQSKRRPFVVRVQGRSTPVLLDGSFTQRPVASSLAMKIVLVVLLLGAWVLLAFFLLGHLSSSTHKKAAAKAAAPPPAAPPGGGVNSGGATGGAGGAGGPGSGAGGSGGGVGGSAAGGAGGSGTPAKLTRVSGKVTAADPSGILVTITPTPLVNENNQAPSAGTNVGASTPVGKVSAQLVSATLSRAVGASLSTTTTSDGSWAFAGIRGPGFFQLTFSKAGYQTRNYVITTTADGQPVQLAAALQPGTGAISGSVKDSLGAALGGVDVTITDGTVSLVTRTPTTGSVGAWSVTGVSTPGTYLITARLAGYATQTSLVTVPAGGTISGQALTMTKGAGSITGTVSVQGSGPAGGIIVTATNGTVTLSATTSTVNPIGSYVLPNLAIPSAYTVTMSRSGLVTQTRQVQLTAAGVVVDGTMTATTGTVSGTIKCTVPTGVEGDNKAACQSGNLANAGISLANDQSIFKTISTTNGTYTVSDVPPGHYTLSSQAFEYSAQIAQVDIASGEMKTVDLSMQWLGRVDKGTGSVSGHIADLAPDPAQPALVICTSTIPCTVTVDGGVAGVGVFGANAGDYTISGLGAGLHSITAWATGHEPITVQASVALNGVGFAPPILLPRLLSLTGIVVSRGPSHFVTGPVGTLFNSQSAFVQPCEKSRTVVVGITKGSTAVTTAAFGDTDVGHPVAGTNLPQGTTIASVSNRLATLSQPASATSSATLIIGPLAVACFNQVPQDLPGHFRLDNITHGTYTVAFSADGFVPSIAPHTPPFKAPVVVFAVNQNQSQDFALDELPQVVVNTVSPGTDGTLVSLQPTCPANVPTCKVSVTLTGASTGATTPQSAPATFTGLPLTTQNQPDTYTVSFTNVPSGSIDCVLPEGSGMPPAGPCSFNGVLNQQLFITAIFSPTPTRIRGQIEWHEGDRGGIASRVPDSSMANSCVSTTPRTTPAPPCITMTAVDYYVFPTPGGPGVPHHTTYKATSTDGIFVFLDSTKVLSPTADFTVLADGFFPFTQPGVPVGPANAPTPFQVPAFNLTPIPVGVTGAVTLDRYPADTSPASFNDVSVDVTYADHTTAPVQITVDRTGAILWVDQSLKTQGQALPIPNSSYQLTFHKPGYDPTGPVTVPVTLCTTTPPCSITVTATLKKQATITASSSAPGAHYALVDHTGAIVQTITAGPDSNNVTFLNVSVVGDNPTYTVTAVAPGYAIPTLTTLPVSSPVPVTAGCPCTATIEMTKLGSISGNLLLRRYVNGPTMPAQGVTISATPTNPTDPSCDRNPPFTTTTGADGHFTITGDITYKCQGLLGSSYVLKASPFGYSPMTQPDVPVNGPSADYFLTATPETISGTVSEIVTTDSGQSRKGIPLVAVTATNQATGTVYPTVISDPSGGFQLVDLPPVNYTVSFSKPTYAPLLNVGLDLQPVQNGVALPTLDVTMALNKNQLKGTTTAVYGSGPTSCLDGVTVTLQDTTDSNKTYSTGPSGSTCPPGSDGTTYLVPDILDGTYKVTFSKPGFNAPASQNVTMLGSNTYIDDSVLSAKTHNVAVTVVSAVPSLPGVIGATVTLQAAGGHAQTQGPQLAGVGGTTTFNQVEPGLYSVVVDGSSANPSHQSCGGPNPACVTTEIQPTPGSAPDPLVINLLDPDLQLQAQIPEGEIAGTATISDGIGNGRGAPEVKVTIAGGVAAVPPPQVGQDGHYVAFLPSLLAPAKYTVSFLLDNYVIQPLSTFNPSTSLGSGVMVQIDARLVKLHDITVSVASDVAGANPLPDGVSVWILDGNVPTSCATLPTQTFPTLYGAYTFQAKAPGPAQGAVAGRQYTICADATHLPSGPAHTTGSAVVAVPVSAADPPSVTVNLHEAEIILSNTSTADVFVKIGPQTYTAFASSPSGLTPYFFPPGTYTVTNQDGTTAFLGSPVSGTAGSSTTIIVGTN